MTTFGHILIIIMYVAGGIGAMLGLMWLRWTHERHKIEQARQSERLNAEWREFWKRQPP